MTTDNARRTGAQPTPRPVNNTQPGSPPAVLNTPTVSPTTASPTAVTRARRAAAWLGWHVLELSGVGVPLALAVMVDGWWAVLAGAIGAGWAGHEIQLARRHRPPRTARLKPCGARRTQRGNSENTEEPSGKDRDRHD